MDNIFKRISNVFTGLTDIKTAVFAIIFIVCLTIAFYFVFKFLKKNEAGIVLYIFTIIFCSFAILIFFLKDNSLSKLFLLVPVLLFIFVATVFSVEIKRIIWSKTTPKHIENKHNTKSFNEEEAENSTNEIIKAVQNMSKNDIGAIIVLSNGNVPDRIIESGIKINSDVTSQLIESVFFPKTPLHDGAMILSGAKIVAAGCFLPLSQKENLPKELGTRHRAGIGITETIDVTTIIVSEETGIISIVKAGEIKRYADSEMLKNVLHKFFWQDVNFRK